MSLIYSTLIIIKIQTIFDTAECGLHVYLQTFTELSAPITSHWVKLLITKVSNFFWSLEI